MAEYGAICPQIKEKIADLPYFARRDTTRCGAGNSRGPRSAINSLTAPQQKASRFDARVTHLSLHAVASLELPSQLPIQGMGHATAQGDGEEDEAPEQRVFPPPATGGKTCGPVGDERDDGELDGGCRRDQAGEQPENDQHRADRLEKEDD